MRAIARKAIPLVTVIMAATACTQAPASPSASSASSARAANSVTVDAGTTYQVIAGFGISEAFGQAVTVHDAAPATRGHVLDLLFSDASGAGLTILRNEISADRGDTIEPAAPSGPAAPPRYLPLSAVNSDQDQLWLAQTIKTDYDGMTLTPAQNANFLGVLGPALAASGLPTRVECCATKGWDLARQYASAIEADPAARSYTSVFTSHGYSAPVTGELPGWAKPAWETEWSTFEPWDPSWDDGSPASGLSWAQHILTALDTSSVSAFLYWWGTSTPRANGDNESLIQVDGATVTPSGRLWAFANFSRFVRPGAVRIAATTTDGGLTVDAFRNTGKTVTVVALNTGASPDTVTFTVKGTGIADGALATPYQTTTSAPVARQSPLRVSGGAFTSTLPPRSLETFQVATG